MVDLLCFVACTLLFVSEELLPAASPWEIGVERSWVGIAGAEGANSFSRLCTTRLHPSNQSQAAALAPAQGLSCGNSPAAAASRAGSQPCLVSLGGTQGAGCWVLGFGSCLHPLITLLQALGCFLPGRLCRCEE